MMCCFLISLFTPFLMLNLSACPRQSKQRLGRGIWHNSWIWCSRENQDIYLLILLLAYGGIYPHPLRITPTLQPSSCQSVFSPLLEGYEVSTSTAWSLSRPTPTTTTKSYSRTSMCIGSWGKLHTEEEQLRKSFGGLRSCCYLCDIIKKHRRNGYLTYRV